MNKISIFNIFFTNFEKSFNQNCIIVFVRLKTNILTLPKYDSSCTNKYLIWLNFIKRPIYPWNFCFLIKSSKVVGTKYRSLSTGNPSDLWMASNSSNVKYPNSNSRPETKPKNQSSQSNSLANQVQFGSWAKNLTKAFAWRPYYSVSYNFGSCALIFRGKRSYFNFRSEMISNERSDLIQWLPRLRQV